MGANRPRRQRSPRTAGIALVLVLGCLVLMTVLVVAFFVSVSTETSTANTASSGASAKFLADSAVNLVEGQIAQATRGKNPASQRLTWASQPGLVRTYDDTGAAANSYKLYSAANMVTTAHDAGLMTELQGDAANTSGGTLWNTQPALYTDLNAPVQDPDGLLHFPILDGNLKTLTVGSDQVLTYDENGDGVPDIEGFGIPLASVPSYQSGKSISPANNPAPMPVRWLYQLQDGTIVSPVAGSSGTQAKFSGATQPTRQNPIVGRIAFWADDETCKLNINTASEGSFYAYPHTNTPMDLSGSAKPNAGFALSPPATGEYNRYPGHPASTCLSVALGAWLDPAGQMATVPSAYTSSGNDQSYLQGLSTYLGLLPRLQFGGSQAGTVSGTPTAYPPITNDTDRLYASVDELEFQPNRQPNPALTKSALDKLHFFLSASNRSADVTPFNTPKVSLWPQWSTLALRNAPAGADAGVRLKPTTALLAFCSSFGQGAGPSGKNEYFVQRLNASSWNSSTQDWSGVPRNRDLANYLYHMGSQAIPGYGGTFATKYGGTAFPNLVVESLDFIRSDVGKLDYLTQDYTNDPQTGNYFQAENYIDPLVVTDTLPGASTTTPLKGFGDAPICTQVVLGLAYTDDSVADGYTLTKPTPVDLPVPFLSFQFFIPTQSSPGANAFIGVSVSGAGNLGISPRANQPALPDSFSTSNYDWNIGNGRMFSWYENKRSTLRAYTWALSGYTWDDKGTTASLGTGGPVTFSFTDLNGVVYQKMTVRFPPVTLPKPTANNNASMRNTQKGDYWDQPTMAYNDGAKASSRGVELSANGPLHGDARLFGAFYDADPNSTKGVTAPANTASYSDSSAAQSHTLRVYTYQGAQPVQVNLAPSYPIKSSSNVISYVTPTRMLAGSLVTSLLNTDYLDYNAPVAPYGMKAALNGDGRPGDWDTGPALTPDGPYLNPVEQRDAVGLDAIFNENDLDNMMTSSFSPNRLIASPVRFGSLPTGVDLTNPRPWQTLLFCPNPAARTTAAGGTPTALDHAGFGTPSDHVFLEFFNMPTVEPYAISEPLSTNGKVNLNTQLAPFTNIVRTTGMRGVLKNTLMTGISPKDAKNPNPGPGLSANSAAGSARYKFPGAANASYSTYTANAINLRDAQEVRYDIDRDATLAGVAEHYFSLGKAFRYGSEICDVFLVPKRLAGASYAGAVPPTTYDNMMSWWNPSLGSDLTKMNLTGDNLREEPYDRIYPRITTKSNTFTVHCRVQVLHKRTLSDPTLWEEGKDLVAAEYRGSSTIERYVDPGDPGLNANWDSDTINLRLDGKADLSAFYQFRVLSTKKFAP